MPTTCGFPNCKFRSRYRGQEDNRHFYRIPKRPSVLRQAWLNAIGRSEETVVSQLRICSAHFIGGEKHEGDIPVADPQIDTPEFIELPPKESRAAERKSKLKALSSTSNNSNNNITSTSKLLDSHHPSSTSHQNFGGIIRHSRRGQRTNFGLNNSLFSHYNHQKIIKQPFNNNKISNQIFGHLNSTNPIIADNSKNIMNLETKSPISSFTSSTKIPPFFPQINNNVIVDSNKLMLFNSHLAKNSNNQSSTQQQFPPLLPQLSLSPHKNETKINLNNNIIQLETTNNFTKNLLQNEVIVNNIKPLVALLDGRDCSVEMPLLKDIATVAFCDAQSICDVHDKVLNEANVALLYQSINLGREEIKKFKSLKAIIKIGPYFNNNIDVNAATELGIAVCNTPVECIEENADSAISLILSLFRKTFSLCNFVQSGKKVSTIEQICELMNGSQRIRGSTLGILGMGRVGIAVALRAKAFGFRVIFYDPDLAIGMEIALGLYRCSNLTELFNQSDCLSLHCPLTCENKHIINMETIKHLKFGIFLINTTEFDLVESNALISALKNGNIRGYAMDCDQPKEVSERENYEILCSMSNVICTPRTGWYCQESHNELRLAAAQEVRRALIGSIPEDLKHCVNKSELLTLKGFFKIGQKNLLTSIVVKDSINSASAIFPQFPFLNTQTSSTNSTINSSIITNNGQNDLFQQLNNFQPKLLNPLTNYSSNFFLMQPNLWWQIIMQMKKQQKQTKIVNNFPESSTINRSEQENKEEINSLLTNSNEIIFKRNFENFNKDEENNINKINNLVNEKDVKDKIIEEIEEEKIDENLEENNFRKNEEYYEMENKDL